MKGKILDYNIQESKGIISGDDGQRYSFSNSEWKSSESPKANQNVDFEIDGNEAKAIYLVKSQIPDFATSLNIEGSEARKGAVFGAIGSGLTFFTIIPFIGFLFGFIGVILEIFGIKKLSDNAKNDRDIFKNYIFGVIFLLVGTVLMGIIMGAGLVGSMASMDMNSNFGTGVGIGTMIFGFVVYIIFGILSIIKFYKALNSIGIEYNVPLMQLVAKGYIVGIVLVPLFGLGYLILFVAFIAKIFAYLKIEKQ
ncbi:DUF996 domain-containing protein [Aliarcobacter cryaerophilus]|uniref:DUF996 domain-containing protein n=1 Tax=Aliarcobacter cryaerophilus TaxID=28198 RepID=UPI0021B63316|nr:DUF996 domain-containing protein [Aliarcobacter cryaerophilus]MCT7488567.1 DUF996 domain-containing protein [Aliarcobacter cryaerophilus]